MPRCKILFKYVTLLALSLFAFICNLKINNISPGSTSKRSAKNAVNINTANISELEKIPFIGKKNARKIVLHRETFGKFRRVEHLMLVRGISEERFRKMRGMIKAK